MKHYKRMKKCGKRGSLCSRYVVLFLIATLILVCLNGCGVQDTAKKPADKLQSEPDIEEKTPDNPYSDQIDTIVQNKDTWCFTMPADAGEEFGYNESDYYYWITDLDQNGYLEVIRSSTTGNGGYYNNDYYEVSPDGKSLIKVETDEGEDAPAADLWSIGEYSRGYYDAKTGTYHYPQPDHTHGSAVDTSDAQLDTVLSKGKVTINTISYVETESYGKPGKKGYGCLVKYYAGAKAEKLGEVREPYDEKTGEFLYDTEKESGYYKQLAGLEEQYYEEMQEFTVTSNSFRNIDEEEYINCEIKVVSDETLRQRIEESWYSFGIHFPNEKAPDNPFFPETAAGDTEVRYLINMLSEGRATMQIQEELRGNDGILYLVTCCDPREVSNREFGDPSEYSEKEEKEEKKWVKKRLRDVSFYLWVTDTQIYFISTFDSDDWALEEDHQKARLVFYNEIPEYARLVCQEEEMKDALEYMAKGDHRWIEKHGEDIRCYRSYTSKGEGYDTSGIVQFIWKRGEGLIGVRFAAHPAGGFSQLFWKETCLDVEDVGFSIDQ